MGAYHFAYPHLNDAEREAMHFINVSGDYLKDGYLRPALDVEHDTAVCAGIGKANLSRWVDTWMSKVKNETGVEPILYTNSNWATNCYETYLTKYDLWIANWTYDLTRDPNDGIWSHWHFWQYGLTNVQGIEGQVDADVFNGNISQLQAFVINTSSQQPSCTLVGDTPPCDEVSISEVLSSIFNWAQGQLSLMDVMALIYAWAAW